RGNADQRGVWYLSDGVAGARSGLFAYRGFGEGWNLRVEDWPDLVGYRDDPGDRLFGLRLPLIRGQGEVGRVRTRARRLTSNRLLVSGDSCRRTRFWHRSPERIEQDDHIGHQRHRVA